MIQAQSMKEDMDVPEITDTSLLVSELDDSLRFSKMTATNNHNKPKKAHAKAGSQASANETITQLANQQTQSIEKQKIDEFEMLLMSQSSQ